MNTFDQAIAELEARHGKIDNIKFLVDACAVGSVDMIEIAFASAVSDYLEGRAVPSTKFHDDSLAMAAIEA